MSKDSGTKSTIPGGRICFDISSVQTKKYGGSKFLLLIVGQCTDISWSYLLERKSDLVTTMIRYIKDLQDKHSQK